MFLRPLDSFIAGVFDCVLVCLCFVGGWSLCLPVSLFLVYVFQNVHWMLHVVSLGHGDVQSCVYHGMLPFPEHVLTVHLSVRVPLNFAELLRIPNVRRTTVSVCAPRILCI